MRAETSWKAFFYKYKYMKFRNLVNYFYPGCLSPGGRYAAPSGSGSGNELTDNCSFDITKNILERSVEDININQGLGYAGVASYLGLGNSFVESNTKTESFGIIRYSSSWNGLELKTGEKLPGISHRYQDYVTQKHLAEMERIRPADARADLGHTQVGVQEQCRGELQTQTLGILEGARTSQGPEPAVELDHGQGNGCSQVGNPE